MSDSRRFLGAGTRLLFGLGEDPTLKPPGAARKPTPASASAVPDIERISLLRAEMRKLSEALVRAIDGGRSTPHDLDREVRMAADRTDRIAIVEPPADFPRNRYAKLARSYVLSDYLECGEQICDGRLKIETVPAFARELIVFAILAFLRSREIDLAKAGALIEWLHYQERRLAYRLRGSAGGRKRPSKAADVATLWARLATAGMPERDRATVIAKRTGLTERAVRKHVKPLRKKAGTKRA